MITQGEMFRDLGIEIVESNNSLFVAMMRDAAIDHAKAHGTVTADDMRRLAVDMGIEPAHPNAWGAVFRTPELTHVGIVQSKTPTCHARLIQIWRLT